MSQFEALIRKEANGFTARRRAACMLRVAAEEEQAGGGGGDGRPLAMGSFSTRVPDYKGMRGIGETDSAEFMTWLTLQDLHPRFSRQPTWNWCGIMFALLEGLRNAWDYTGMFF